MHYILFMATETNQPAPARRIMNIQSIQSILAEDMNRFVVVLTGLRTNVLGSFDTTADAASYAAEFCSSDVTIVEIDAAAKIIRFVPTSITRGFTAEVAMDTIAVAINDGTYVSTGFATAFASDGIMAIEVIADDVSGLMRVDGGVWTFIAD